MLYGWLHMYFGALRPALYCRFRRLLLMMASHFWQFVSFHFADDDTDTVHGDTARSIFLFPRAAAYAMYEFSKMHIIST